ncbi:hypothetical protein H8356DRAFT_1271406 [Neocallimastix lanati (nom. inval.)]|nr:hypothetical protein H8356DRAFT_1271406 [Neocallimastix sp. JGI-2020a]
MAKKGLFDIADDAYMKEFLEREFINDADTNHTEILIYKILFIIINIYEVISLIYFIKLRKSYIIRQRNFTLTFIGGIIFYITTFISFFPQMMKVPCFLSAFSTNILNPMANLIFLSRTFRVILFYHFNIFKVTSIKNKKENLNNNYDINLEPNNYLPRISKKINKIICCIIFIPTMISAAAVAYFYITDPQMKEKCPFFKREDALKNLKTGKGVELFKVILVYGYTHIFISFIITILLIRVKDSNKYGVKFECLSSCIVIITANILDNIIQANSRAKGPKKPRIIFIRLFELTKGGKMLFTIILLYLFFVSITLPVIQYYIIRKSMNKEFKDQRNTIQYLYKVLNTPSLVDELREIAVNEFCVENVLFWENYQILQKKVYRYQLDCIRSKEMGNVNSMINSLDTDDDSNLHQYPMKSYNLIECYTYDPDMPVPNEILPYYISFYHMFIDINGPAVVNISRDVANQIFFQLSTFPSLKNQLKDITYFLVY